MDKLRWVLLGAVALVFLPALISLAGVWSSVDYYSHGFLVPVVSLFIAQRDGKVGRPPAGPLRDPIGLGVVALAAVLMALGRGAGSVAIQGVALVAAVAGGGLALWGREGLRALAFPLAFLLFMVPLPATWLGPLIVDLQFFVSATAVSVLEALGAEVTRTGNVLTLAGGESLFVAEACSGITSIVTLVPLGVVLAYFTERTRWRRAAIVAAVIPIAMLANLVRVVGTVIAAQSVGVEAATEGPLHESSGVVIFVLACLVLIGVGPLLRRVARPA